VVYGVQFMRFSQALNPCSLFYTFACPPPAYKYAIRFRRVHFRPIVDVIRVGMGQYSIVLRFTNGSTKFKGSLTYAETVLASVRAIHFPSSAIDLRWSGSQFRALVCQYLENHLVLLTMTWCCSHGIDRNDIGSVWPKIEDPHSCAVVLRPATLIDIPKFHQS
jgi:hypothetical protein